MKKGVYPDYLQKEISKRIREERQMQKMTQQELADKTGQSRFQISQWENGQGLRIENADKLMRALGISYTIGAGRKKVKGE